MSDNLTVVGGAARSQPVSLVISKVTSAGGSVLHADHGQVAVAGCGDRTFETKDLDGEQVLEGKCIHCQRKLTLRTDGTALNGATLEHIVPKNSLSSLGPFGSPNCAVPNFSGDLGSYRGASQRTRFNRNHSGCSQKWAVSSGDC